MADYEWLTEVSDGYHRFIIPSDKLDDWYRWLDIPMDDARSWEEPEYAIRVEGRVVFKEFMLI